MKKAMRESLSERKAKVNVYDVDNIFDWQMAQAHSEN
jgi:hypothetical protein